MAGAAQVVVVRDGLPSAGPAQPGDFLRSLPPGTYTAARMWHRRRVAAWPAHVSRLAESLRLLRGEAASEETERALRAAVSSSLRVALSLAGPGDEGAPELMLVVHVAQSWQPGGEGVTVHLSVAPPLLPAAPPAPAAAAVLGTPRTQPLAKCSLWVAQRRRLEEARPAECAETLLSNEAGALLEGVTSNLFVVLRLPDGTPELHTASLEDGVLGGIARLLVLQAARRMGLAVVEAAPLPPPPDGVHAAFSWAEAFVCSSVRGIRPLSLICWLPPLDAPVGAQPPRPPLQLADAAPGPVTLQLHAALQAAWASAGSDGEDQDLLAT